MHAPFRPCCVRSVSAAYLLRAAQISAWTTRTPGTAWLRWSWRPTLSRRWRPQRTAMPWRAPLLLHQMRLRHHRRQRLNCQSQRLKLSMYPSQSQLPLLPHPMLWTSMMQAPQRHFLPLAIPAMATMLIQVPHALAIQYHLSPHFHQPRHHCRHTRLSRSPTLVQQLPTPPSWKR